MFTLRPYQVKGVADIRAAYGQGARTVLYQLSTGGGKTVLFSFIAHQIAARQSRVYILSHRVELVDQISAALLESETRHSFVAAGYGYVPDHCMVCSVPTLLNRLDSVAPPDFIIVDEAHHSRASTWEAVLTKWPKAKILGVTATPVRPSGEGLGTLFKALILGPPAADLIRLGFLANPRVYAPPTVDTSGLHTRMGEFVTSEAESLMDKPSITGNALDNYRERTDGWPALAFCVSIDHAEHVAEQFRGAGYSAIALSGKTDRDLRRGCVRDYKAGRIQLLSSCQIFSEGFDCPGARVGIFLNPTQSVVKYLQEGGRIMRPGGDKVIHDHVGNTLRHGLLDEPREWSLDGEDKKKKKKAIGVKVCSSCFSAVAGGVMVCPACGYVFPPQPRMVETRDGKLVELTPELIAQRRAKRDAAFEQSDAKSLDALISLATRRGYKNPEKWARIVYKSRKDKGARQ